jgi:hypothetical protein
MEFDDVDRNIVRELSVRFIDMVQENAVADSGLLEWTHESYLAA